MDFIRGKRSIPPVLWIFLLAVAVRLIVLGNFGSSPHFLPKSGDMRFYNDWALRVVGGQFTDHKAFYGLPGYAYLLAAIYAVAGYSPYVVGLLQTFAEAGTSVILFLIAQEVAGVRAIEEEGFATGRGEAVGWIAAVGWIFFQPAQTFSVILMPTCWLVLLYWGCIWRILKIRNPSLWSPWLWFGLAIGVMAMMVATILFLIPLVMVAAALKLDSHQRLAVRLPKVVVACAILMAGVLTGMSPCWIHNYFIAREPVLLSAHSGLNFYIGNNELANGYPKIPPGMRAGQKEMLKDSIVMAEAAAGHPLKRVEVSKFWSAKADAYIHAHFGDWLKLMGVKFKNIWNAYQYDDLSLVSLFSQDGILTPGLKFGFVAVLGIPGIFIGVVRYRRSRWVVAAIFLHMAALMPVFVTERYRMAAVPGLLLMAALGLWEFWSSLARGRWVFSGGYAAGVVAALWFVTLPMKELGVYSLDYYNTGIKALEAVQSPETEEEIPAALMEKRRVLLLRNAQENLETAFAYVPENSEINFSLGNLWLEKGDREMAKKFYLRALSINVRQGGAYNNLGVLELQDRHWGLAEKLFEHAAVIEPGDAKVYFLLAQARLGGGNIPGAAAAIDRALQLAPSQKQFLALKAEIEEKGRPNVSR